MRRFPALFLPLALSLLAAPPAAAQGEDFYVQQYNSAARDLSRNFSELQSLRERMHRERDFTVGCGLLSSVIYRLEEMQRILKTMLEYLDQLGDVDAYNSSVTDYNNLVEDLNGSRDDYQRLCSG
jgi:hypothetical protein